MKDPIVLVDALTNENVKAFLWMLRYGEGTATEDGYRVVFGGAHLAGLDGVPGTADDFADHPRKVVTRTMKGKVYKSSAAGAYQAMPPTWDEEVARWGFTNFEPKTQDMFAVARLIYRKALQDVIDGRFERAVMKCNKEWASLPGSPYGQPVVTMEQARKHYEEHGGTYAPGATDQPTEAKEPPMAPFIAAALPSLISAIPELAKMFSSGSEVSERNIKAAEVVVGIAKDAIGAKNEQELVESMQSDPQAVSAVRQAVRENWFQLDEIGGGVVAAREENRKVQGDRSFLFNPAVWIAAAFLPLIYFVVIRVLAWDGYSDEIRIMVVTAIVSGLLGSLTGYFFGTSASSRAKDQALLKQP